MKKYLFMKKLKVGLVGVIIAAGLMFAACNAPEEAPAVVKTDMASVKSQIQELENAWADASNARNLEPILAMMADDAITMPENKPMVVGKAAIKEYMEAQMAKNSEGSTVSFETVEVFGSEDQVTEVGKYIDKDASGKVTSTGKYVAVWEKRDGKYVCIRDMGTSDAKTD